MKKIFISILFFILLVIFLIKVLAVYKADVFYKRSRIDYQNNHLNSALENIDKSIGLNSKEPTYLRYKARILLTSNVFSPEEKLKKEAKHLLDKAFSLNTKNLTTIRNSTLLYFYLGYDPVNNRVDEDYIQVTIDYFDYLKSEYPNDLGIYVEIAGYEKRLNLLDDFEDTKKHVERMRPDILDWHESFL